MHKGDPFDITRSPSPLTTTQARARKAFMETHEIYSRIGNDLGAANALSGLGYTYHAQSKNAEAENAPNDAHKIYSRIGDSIGTGNALRSFALLQNRYDAADSE